MVLITSHGRGRRLSSQRRHAVVFTLGCALVASQSARGGPPCPTDWLPGEGHPGVTGELPVWALTQWDPDGAGSQPEVLVAGGGFFGAGNVTSFGIATWNGSQWHALGDGGGMNDQVMALTVYNGDLIAAGFFTTAGGVPANRIARWDSKTWHSLGSGLNIHSVRALTVYNGELYAGGFFDQAGGVPATGIARWNGSTWSDVGGGVFLNPAAGATAVFAMTVFDGKLIVGGGFDHIGGPTGAPARHIASWNGSTWQPMDGGTSISVVESLGVYNNQLIAGAMFFSPSAQFIRSISRWTGTTWGPLGTGVNDTPNDAVRAIIQYNGDLYAGGIFWNAGGVSTPNHLARWNGTTWSTVLGGFGAVGRSVRSFALYNGSLIAGGTTSQASGLQASAVGRWDGAQWHYMGGGVDAIVYDFATYDGDLIAGGWFSHAGDVEAHGLARRDSAGQWHAFGNVSGGDGFVFDMVVHNNTLIVSGSFLFINGVSTPNSIAQWNGNTWQAFGNTPVGKKLVHNGELYAPGGFGPNQRVAKWDPIAQTWQPIGTFPPNVGITALTFFNGDLIAGGIGGIGATASVWRWDFDNPGTWQPIGQHLGSSLIQTLGVYDGELLVGGYSDGFGGPPGGLARFNGTSWVPFAGGTFLGNESPDEILAVFDLRINDGDLIVAGTFSYAGAQQYTPETVAAFHLARWNGENWSTFGSGTNNATVTLHEHQGVLYTGGWFTMANGAPAGYWAHWGSSCPLGDVNQDGSVDVDDLLVVIINWGPCPRPPTACPADLDDNGTVNVDDLLAVIVNWG